MTFKQKDGLHFDCCMKVKETSEWWLFDKSDLSVVSVSEKGEIILIQCLVYWKIPPFMTYRNNLGAEFCLREKVTADWFCLDTIYGTDISIPHISLMTHSTVTLNLSYLTSPVINPDWSWLCMKNLFMVQHHSLRSHFRLTKAHCSSSR